MNKRKVARHDAFESLCKIGERLEEELKVSVRYIESTEHNGNHYEWECFKDGEWQLVDGKFFQSHSS